MIDKFINNNLTYNMEEFALFAFSPVTDDASKAIDIVYHLFQSDYIESKIKEEYYIMLVLGLSWAIYHRPFDVLGQIASDYKKAPLAKKDLIKQLLNHQDVIKTYSNCVMQEKLNRNISDIVDMVRNVYSNKTMLQILKGNPKDKLFLVFGCHPVIAEYVDLQKRWISCFVKYPTISRHLKEFYVSGEALESVSVEIAFEFIRRIARRGGSSLNQLNKEAVRKVTALYATVYGIPKLPSSL